MLSKFLVFYKIQLRKATLQLPIQFYANPLSSFVKFNMSRVCASDIAMAHAGHAEQDQKIANMLFCIILKNVAYILYMNANTLEPYTPLQLKQAFIPFL